jgi:hypothetical protein
MKIDQKMEHKTILIMILILRIKQNLVACSVASKENIQNILTKHPEAKYF